MNNKYQPFNKFLLRTPALSFKYTDLTQVDYHNPIFQEAIYVASKELYVEMTKYLKEGTNIDGKEEKRLKESLAKYWKRMISRTTPYGLFSGVSVGEIRNEDTSIVLNKPFTRRVRLDMGIVFSLVDFLENDELIKEEILYFPNDTIYIVYNQIRFYERISEQFNMFKYTVSKVDYSKFLKKVINFCETGKSIGELIKYVCALSEEINIEDARDFILEVINSKIIISELNPCLTGTNVLDDIIQTLQNRKSKSPLLKKLQTLNDLINSTNHGDGGIKALMNIESFVKEIGFKYDDKNVLQIDLYKESEMATINSSLISEITEAIEFLTKINNPKIKDEALENFKRAFSERFEEKEVSLLFATDADVGIGYPVNSNGGHYSNSLIKNISNYQRENKQIQKVSWDSWQAMMLKKIIEASSSNLKEVVISEEDFSSNTSASLYPTFYCSFEIIDNSNETMTRLNGFGGSSGALLMSRFAYMNKDIEELVRKIADKEQELSQEPILEIIHVTIPRVANVLLRPQLRDFELLILGNSTLSDNCKIPLSDIMVSLKNNNLVLRSKSLNKNIKVANTNAFNHDLSTVPAFNLLCDLQYDNDFVRNIPFALNLPLNYIPRIRYKNVIIDVATWHFKFIEIEPFFKENLEAGFLCWRKQYNIPRFVLFCERDNELIFDFENKNEIFSFYNTAKKRGSFILKEILFNDDSTVVTDENRNPYRNEFIVAFHKK